MRSMAQSYYTATYPVICRGAKLLNWIVFVKSCVEKLFRN